LNVSIHRLTTALLSSSDTSLLSEHLLSESTFATDEHDATTLSLARPSENDPSTHSGE
jgi:hypothetical protein